MMRKNPQYRKVVRKKSKEAVEGLEKAFVKRWKENKNEEYNNGNHDGQ
jgi:hypothetical protein